MLTKNFKSLFSKKNLLWALEHYRKHKDYSVTRKSIEEGTFRKILSEGFVPDPMATFEIPKHSGEMRQIAVASLSSKVIQRVIANALNEAIVFSDKSYAFREGKGPTKAVNRTKDFLKKYRYVAKADIDDFFDSIEQEKLLQVLKLVVSDEKILMVIALFLKNGMMKKSHWIDKTKGVYQGDVLSPVLSNLYLHTFDMALEKHRIAFVRFADDMVFFAHSKKEAKSYLSISSKILKNLGLYFGEEKSYLASVDENGFEFLGLRFKSNLVMMDNTRLMEKLSILSQKTKRKDLVDSIVFFNEYIAALRRYYLHVLSDLSQLAMIEDHIDSILIRKIMFAKEHKVINKKSKLVQYLSDLKSVEESSMKERTLHANELVSKAYEAIALQKPLDTAKKVIDKKKNKYLQEQMKSSEIILNKFGLYASINRGKIVIKEYGKVIKKMPLNWVSRIIVMTKGASFSSALIYECSRKKIDIDFIEKQRPYAQITYYSTINNELHLKQIAMKNDPKGLEIAKSIIKSKMKNQINLLKYYNRYREETNKKEFKNLDALIVQMQSIGKRVAGAKDVPMLMGYEGSVSVLYWRGFGLLIGKEDFTRETQNAPDAINQSLNYGYAFIYHRVQSALLKAGVNIYHSFLHTPQDNKPTLVFDMVEVFRQPVVDREIISILNLGTKLNSSKGRLNQKSIKVITENVQERLSTQTRWRKGKYKIETIINDQALEMAHVIRGIKKNFKGFVARF